MKIINFLAIIRKIYLNLGLKRLLVYKLVWLSCKFYKLFKFMRFTFFSNYSKKYNSPHHEINSLFKYHEISNFDFKNRGKYLKNKLQVFSKDFSNYSTKVLQGWSKNNHPTFLFDTYRKNIFNEKRKYERKKITSTNWYNDHLGNKNFHMNDKIIYDEGIDIKVPWEVARFQHLNKICIFAYLNKLNTDYDFIKFQILDFIFFNPPKVGIHWLNAMEVAIRGSNLSMITDILVAENQLNDKEKLIFFNSINDHLIFVLENIEWSPLSRNNHYLANIIGIMVMSYFLPKDRYLRSIMKFSVEQFLNEIDFQFYDDGGSREGSTSYHVFSSEMILIGLYFFKKIKSSDLRFDKSEGFFLSNLFNKISFIKNNSEKITMNYQNKMLEKVKKIFFFSKLLLRNNNSLLQVGDNDSGCFFDLDLSKDCLEKKKIHILLSEKKSHSLFHIIKKFVGNDFFENFNKKPYFVKKKRVKVCSNKHRKSFFIPFNEKVNINKIKLYSFKDFGLYCYLHKKFSLYVICKSNYEYYNSGHLHDDNLAIDLVINNKNIITDPGSLCYTSDFSVRNKYRSIDSHFAPRKLGCHLKENAFPFSFKNFLKGKVINVDKDFFFGKISYKNCNVFRKIEILSTGLKINDYCSNGKLSNYKVLDSKEFISTSYRVLGKDRIIQINLK